MGWRSGPISARSAFSTRGFSAFTRAAKEDAKTKEDQEEEVANKQKKKKQRQRQKQRRKKKADHSPAEKEAYHLRKALKDILSPYADAEICKGDPNRYFKLDQESGTLGLGLGLT